MLSRLLKLAPYRTPLYSNTGSVARDHLASERTFLAWVRTGLGFIALGIAVERFQQLDINELVHSLKPDDGKLAAEDDDESRDRDKAQSQVLVGSLLGLGSGSIVYGASRYFSNLKHLERGYFKPAYHGAAVLAAAVAGFAGGVYGSAVRRSWEGVRERESERERQRQSGRKT